METLRCEGIRKYFDGVCALADVSLRFPSSGVMAIIGPNGAGKTTLLNVVTGFTRADRGRCFLGRRETTRLPPYQVARLGVARTFQGLRVVQHASVLNNVLLARPNQRGERLLWAVLGFGVAREEHRNSDEAKRLLGSVGLAPKALAPAGDLSYGEQKLLSLACCVATDARIILLDEPVAGVHPEMVTKILGLLGQLRADGKLVVFVEHNIGAVRQVADQVIVMDEGKIIAQGVPEDVLKQPEILEAYVG